MSKITPAEVQRLAQLARIGVTDSEAKHLATELDQIVGYVEQLSAANLDDSLEPTSQVTGLVDVTREDVVVPGLAADAIAVGAPSWQDGQFKVKRVLAND